ncbi:MAG: PD-(D/E)XK nuclease family protein [Bacteroidota bacterium]|nr:exodeoxyribonuclease V subunit gamma [Candidatus Kapabacteria bacterium]MDW8219756.1 PD-(D/E)XK nuclease family protein [Bacteroidota bacterium]
MYVLHNSQPSRFAYNNTLEEIFEQEVAEQAHTALQSVICIVPTERRVRLLKRIGTRTVFQQTGKPVSQLQIFTFEGFVRHVATLLFGNTMPRIASEALIAALMEEASERCRQNMKFFTSGSGTFQAIAPAVLERLSSIILGLKEDGITPDNLRADLHTAHARTHSVITDPKRLADIATLYEAYQNVLGDTVVDYPQLLHRVTSQLTTNSSTGNLHTGEQITKQWSTLLPHVTTLVIDGFTAFKKPEEHFLAALFYAPFHVRILLDYSDVNGPLFGGLQHVVASLQGIGGAPTHDGTMPLPLTPCYKAYTTDAEPNHRFKEQREQHYPKASYLRRWLFNTEEDIRHDGFNETIHIIAFKDRAEEVRSIAKLIRYYALYEAVPLREMCIVMRRPEQYSSLFREMFALYDIPSNITDRFPLEKSPVVTAIFAVLDMVLYGYKRDDVHRALQSPYLRFERKEQGRQNIQLNAANLFSVAERLRIRGGMMFGRNGAEQWIQRMNSRLEHLSKRLTALNQDPNADSDELAETQRYIEEIELAARDFTALLTMLPSELTTLTPTEFAEFVMHRIITQFRVYEQICAFHQDVRALSSSSFGHDSQRMTELLRLDEEVEQDARALAELLKIIQELTAFLQERDSREYLFRADLPKERKRPFAEYVERLRTAVRRGRYQIREKLGYGVTITTIEQIRSIPFRVIILCGAVDGEFPGRYVPETFLGKELPESEERFLQGERIQFYQALTNNPHLLESGKQRIFITYPLYSDAGEELTRSSFIDALLKVTALQQSGKVFNAVELRAAESIYVANHEHEERWIRYVLSGLASYEEVIRSAAISYSTSTPAQRSNALVAYEDYLLDTRVRARFGRVQQYLDRILSVSRSSSAMVRVTTDSSLMSKSVYSVSALEQYAKCPYQFFAARVIRLRELRSHSTTLSPLERGILIHRILYRFYRTVQQEQKTTSFVVAPLRPNLPELIAVRLDPSERQHYYTLLRSLAEEEIKSVYVEHPFFEIECEMLLGTPESVLEDFTLNDDPAEDDTDIRRKHGMLEIWLDSELQRAAGSEDTDKARLFAPVLFECAFGELSSPLPSIAISEHVRLRGKIDRIELLRSDHPDKPHAIIIGDYKTGIHIPSKLEIQHGLSLQMPLYSLAAQHILREEYGLDTRIAGAVYYLLDENARTRAQNQTPGGYAFAFVLKDSHLTSYFLHKAESPSKSPKSQIVDDTAAMEELLEHARTVAEQYAVHIRSGLFPVRPRPSSKKAYSPCTHCAFPAVCRIRELQ